MKYFTKVHFIYDDDSVALIQDMESNEFDTNVVSIHVDEFIDSVSLKYQEIEHLVVSVSQKDINPILSIAHKYNISVGIVPIASRKEQLKNLYCSTKLKENIDIALRDDTKGIDLVEINGELIYSQGIIGTVPLVGDKLKSVRSSFFKTLIYSVKKFFSIELQKFEITTKNGQKITTAGSAIIILNHTKNGFLSKIFKFNQSMRDGKITIIIISPYSVFEYFELLASIFISSKEKKSLPKAMGYLQSESFIINASSSQRVRLDDKKGIKLPLECKVVPEAIKINASEEFWSKNEKITSTKETIKISNLPDSGESVKYMSNHIPFFKSASEERFKELFQILRVDSKLDRIFLVLMVLSTLLASFGLFANSTAVIIGAMLVAPLMIPIVSVSMGFLRGDTNIISDSLMKIGVGVLVALISSATLAFFLPNFELTSEMRSRINPTLLDLAVAIFSGIAAAYSKSFKQISQNLAGVAIAVALVPPLAVAGIGLGYGELYTFLGAFLLFFTNLVGIIIAAVTTFWLLGFSNVVKSKKSVAFILVLILGVSYPLYISYDNMISKYQISKKLKEYRFLVNNKYIIVDNATVIFYGDTKVVNLDLAVRESLNRDDFEELKLDIERLFDEKLFIKTQVKYIS